MRAHRVTLVAYFVAHLGKSLLWAAADLLAFYALVAGMAMPADQAGGVILVALAVNAAADMVIGLWIDRWPPSVPMLARVAMTAMPVAGLAFAGAVLAVPWGWGAVLAGMLTFRIAYALYDLPHNALLGRLVDIGFDAADLARWRTLTSAAMALVTAAVAARLLTVPTDPQRLGLALAGLVVVTTILALPAGPLLRRWGALPRNRTTLARAAIPGSVVPFLAASAIATIAVSGVSKAMLHTQGGATHDPGTLLLLYTLGRLVATMLPTPHGFATAWQAAPATGYVLLAATILLLATGVSWPGIFLFGIASGWVTMVNWLALLRVATGATPYGAFSTLNKLALGVSVPFASMFLGVSGALDDATMMQLLSSATMMTAGAAALATIFAARVGRARRARCTDH